MEGDHKRGDVGKTSSFQIHGATINGIAAERVSRNCDNGTHVSTDQHDRPKDVREYVCHSLDIYQTAEKEGMEGCNTGW